MRIAFFTPLSPLHTAIADHSEGLLPHMAELAEIDLYIDEGYAPANREIAHRFAIRRFHEFPLHSDRYDAVLYAVGDDARFHKTIYEMSQHIPGVAILHDSTLHRMLINLALRAADPDIYVREMRYAYGCGDFDTAWRVIAGFGEEQVTRYPLFERLVDRSLGVIVHNEQARRTVLNRCPGAGVRQINQHFFLPPGMPGHADTTELRARLGLDDRFVVGSLGLFVGAKRLDACLRAFARFRECHPQSVYLLVGSHPKGYDLPKLIRDLGLDGHVVLTGWMEPVAFTQHMYLLDVAIHLRYPHIGGTPFTPIRLMGLGIPTLLSDIAPLQGFPEGTCAKIPVGEYEEETIFRVLCYLAEHEPARRQLGRNGARWIAEHHDAARLAAQYLDAIRSFAQRTSMSSPLDSQREHRARYLVRELAAWARCLGRGEDDAFLTSLAGSLARETTVVGPERDVVK
jgi:glycosyltransferase involved in cell wall biosynthesis